MPKLEELIKHQEVINVTKTEKFYNTKLQRYFDKYYSDYAETAEFYVNPEINKWRFIIPELELNILLTCYDDGRVVERREVLE